jgi:hypothetical protein
MVCIGYLTACLSISCKLGPLIREGVVVMTPATLKQGQPSTYILPGYNFCRNATAPCPRHNQQSTWRAPGLDMGLMDTTKKGRRCAASYRPSCCHSGWGGWVNQSIGTMLCWCDCRSSARHGAWTWIEPSRPCSSQGVADQAFWRKAAVHHSGANVGVALAACPPMLLRLRVTSSPEVCFVQIDVDIPKHKVHLTAGRQH